MSDRCDACDGFRHPFGHIGDCPRKPDRVETFIKAMQARVDSWGVDPVILAGVVKIWLRRLSDDDRAIFFERMRDAFCQHCGAVEPETGMRCQCWNDE